MKRFVFLAALMLIAAVAASSCTKEQYSPDPLSSVIEERTQGVTLVIDAPNLTVADIYFLDEDNVAVSSNTVVVPASASTPVDVNFVTSDGSTPKYLFTPGCINGDELGRIPIPAQSVRTKAGNDPILVVIRK